MCSRIHGDLQRQLLGHWRLDDGGSISLVTFRDRKYYWHRDGDLLPCQARSYAIDFTQSPAHLDWPVRRTPDFVDQSIVEFLDSDTVRIQISDCENRPTDFEDSCWVLRRSRSVSLWRRLVTIW